MGNKEEEGKICYLAKEFMEVLQKEKIKICVST